MSTAGSSPSPEDGPMLLFLVDPGLGPLSRLLDLVLHWDLE